jgi:hypothetical protein
VFSSPRLENVERVAKMLEDEGIEVRITNGRSYRGTVRGNFSYRHNDKPLPALWIIKSEDQPRARAMLREAGLMDSSRNAPDSFIAVSFRGADPYEATPAQKRSFRIKVGLLLGITVVLAMALIHGSKLETTSAAPKPAATRAQPAPAAPIQEAVIADAATDVAPAPANPVVATPAALAEIVFTSGLREQGDRVACLALDGKDAPATLVASLARGGDRVVAASACSLPSGPGQSGRHDATGRAAWFLEVGSYRPDKADGGRSGTLQRSAYGGDRAPVHDLLAVRRTGDGWQIVGPAAVQAP